MKRSLSLFAMMLIASISLFSTDYNRVLSEISIRAYNHRPIIVDLDGRRINHHPDRNVELRDVVPGDRRITVLSARHGFHGPHVLTDQVIRIRPNSRLRITVDRWGELKIREQVRHYCDRCGSFYYGNHQCNAEIRHSHGYGPLPYHPQPKGYGYGHGQHHQYGMQQVRFNQLRQSIRRASFESTKKSIMRQGLAGRQITARQLQQLLGLLSFESSKVEMAKWAYGNVVDKENIFVIYREFSFESSVRQLEKHFARW